MAIGTAVLKGTDNESFCAYVQYSTASSAFSGIGGMEHARQVLTMRVCVCVCERICFTWTTFNSSGTCAQFWKRPGSKYAWLMTPGSEQTCCVDGAIGAIK